KSTCSRTTRPGCTTAPPRARSARSRRCWRSTACVPRCDSRAAATSTPPAASSRLRLRRARLARPEQALAQRRLVLRARVPLLDLGQLVERAQAEQLEEQRRGPGGDGAGLGGGG